MRHRQRHRPRRRQTQLLTCLALAAGGCVRPVAPAPNKPSAILPIVATADPLAGCAVADLPPPRLWRLTQTQLRNTLEDVFGFTGTAVDSLPAESRLEGFANSSGRLGVPPLLMDRYNTISDEIASEAIRRSASLLRCPLAELGRRSCLNDFLTGFGRRLWRRPLSEAETTRLQAVYSAAAEATDPENGFRSLIKALLLSPHFLFRSELGTGAGPDGVVRLTDFELASQLSYLLWDSTPDDTLLELAAAGRLHHPEVLRAEAGRLLRVSRRAAPVFAGFVRDWLKIEDLARSRKDRKRFPMYSSSVAGDLLEENRRFVDSVAFDPGGDRRLRTLLTAGYGYVNARTAVIYGLDAPAGSTAALAGAAATAPGGTAALDATALRQRPLDPAQRRGIFTQGAFLAAHASQDTPKLVARGSLVREQVLCGEVPEPPDEFKFDDSKVTEDMTAREKFTVHTRSAFCARCHALFDGIGFALESYDAIGRFRTTDKDKPIDPSGTLTVPGKPELRFANFVELAEQLAELPETYDCFSRQYLTFATGRSAPEVSACEARAVARAFTESGHRLDALMLAVVESPGFSLRNNAPVTAPMSAPVTAPVSAP